MKLGFSVLQENKEVIIKVKALFQNVITSLMIQLLRLCLPLQGVWVQSLVGELRFHMPHGQKNQVIK